MILLMLFFFFFKQKTAYEIMGGAATHGFLPLLGCDESVRLQLLLGRSEHERLFGRAPAGCWLPECAYRARGPWAPLPSAPASDERPGTEEFEIGRASCRESV